jgi:hypothetical protein
MKRLLVTSALAWALAAGSTGVRADEAAEDAVPPAPEAEAEVPEAPARAPAPTEGPARADVPSVNDPVPESEYAPSEKVPAGSSVSFPVDI